MPAHKAIVVHKLTKKKTEISVSDGKTEEDVRSHLEKVIPDHAVESVEMAASVDGKEVPDDPAHPRLDPAAKGDNVEGAAPEITEH